MCTRMHAYVQFRGYRRDGRTRDGHATWRVGEVRGLATPPKLGRAPISRPLPTLSHNARVATARVFGRNLPHSVCNAMHFSPLCVTSPFSLLRFRFHPFLLCAPPPPRSLAVSLSLQLFPVPASVADTKGRQKAIGANGVVARTRRPFDWRRRGVVQHWLRSLFPAGVYPCTCPGPALAPRPILRPSRYYHRHSRGRRSGVGKKRTCTDFSLERANPLQAWNVPHVFSIHLPNPDRIRDLLPMPGKSACHL